MEAEVARPEFWNDNEKAQEVLKERTLLQKLVEDWQAAANGLEDVQVMIELGEESEDEEALAEVREMLPALEKSIGRMEFAFRRT